MISPLDSHFKRFEFVLLQLCLIVLSLLVCFGSTQCPATTSECDAMNALNTSLNLPTSITNYGNNQTNPCSKKKKRKKKKDQTSNLQKLFSVILSIFASTKKFANRHHSFFFLSAWQGVNCSSSSTQIIQIDWESSTTRYALNGTIPTEIGLMTSLQKL